jgi:hypothetical protein
MRKISFLIMILMVSSTLACRSLEKTRAIAQDYPTIQETISASSTGNITYYSVQFNGSFFLCSVLSNSSVSGFTFFDEPQKEITINVTGETGTAGFCNITIPKLLIEPPYIMLLDGLHAWPQLVTLKENATHESFCYNYTHSTHKIEIIAATSVPEFPTIMSNIMVLAVLALVLSLTKRRSGVRVKIIRNGLSGDPKIVDMKVRLEGGN